ncbi:recombinase family protein [Nocardia mangyaensis]|uniref:recombinase family protein n=1 Tax=Nocardia mangyaensis TaxID=2213200 RepID=UPI00267519EF|nr:recombinase family protein [Nocardia mangyaensis]MDO3645655.1 recombinase family protein [Nocardia mangyaensis]
MNSLRVLQRLARPHHIGYSPLFPPAVLFLSIASTNQADLAAGGEPIRIGVQRQVGHRTALQHGIGIVKEFIEIGAPATSLRRRPTLRRLIAYLKHHPDVRYVIFPGPQRFAKTRAHAELLRGHFQSLNVLVLLALPGSQHDRELLLPKDSL